MGEFNPSYASNAKGNTGVALGATGLGLAVAALANSNNGLGGILGNLFGNNNNGVDAKTAAALAIAQKDAEISMLKSENYSDKVGKEIYTAHLVDQNKLRDELYSFIKPLAEESANNRVNTARLEEQLKCCCDKQELREQVLAGKINEVAIASNGRFNTLEAQVNGNFNTLTTETNCRFSQLNESIACLAGKVEGITSTYVPACKVTPIPMPLANSHTEPATGTTFYPGCVSVGTGTGSTPAA